ncbi:MAG: hypothetical protein Q9221_003889 [Calogaya cf. arnoldii]
MAPVAPTAAQIEKKKKEKAAKQNQANAEGQNQTKESGSPVVMNSDGALAPETPYAIPTPATKSSNQTLPPTGTPNSTPNSAAPLQTVPVPASGGFKIPSKGIFDFAFKPPTNGSSPQPPANNGLNVPSKPAFGAIFGQGPTSSTPQTPGTNNGLNFPSKPAFGAIFGQGPTSSTPQTPGTNNGLNSPSKPAFGAIFGQGPTSSTPQTPGTNNGLNVPSKPAFGAIFGQGPTSSAPQTSGTNNFNPVPTSAKAFDPLINPEIPKMNFSVPAYSPGEVEGPRLTDSLKAHNAHLAGATTIQQIEQTNLAFKHFDLGMQMRQCQNDPGELNRCITVWEAKDATKAMEIKKMYDEYFKLQRQAREARENGMTKLKEATSTIEAKDLCIAQLERENEAFKATAENAYDQQAKELFAKDQEIARLERENEAFKATAENAYDQQAKELFAKDQEIARIERENEAFKATAQSARDQHAKQLDAKDQEIAELKETSEAFKAQNVDGQQGEQPVAKDKEIAELKATNERAQSVQGQQAEQIIAKDEEIANLKATNSALETTNKDITEKAEEDLEKKDRWIAELEHSRQDADDRYKGLVVSQEQEKLNIKRTYEDREADLEAELQGYRDVADAKSGQFDGLRQQVKDANIKAKTAEDHARSSDDKVEEQANAIDEYETRIGVLDGTIERFKKELQDSEEEMKSMTREKDNGPADHHDCRTEIQRLKSEKKQEIDELHRHYALTHAEDARRVQQEMEGLQEASTGLSLDLYRVQQRVQEHEQTIEKLQQENQRLQSEIDDPKKEAAAGLYTTNKTSVEPDADERHFLSSHTRHNELSEFSPALSRPGTPECGPGPWRPQTESMMGDSDDGDDEGHRPDTQNLGLGIANGSREMCDQGTQTSTPPSTPNLSFSKIATIVDYKPNSPKLSISKPMTIFHDTPSPAPFLGISGPGPTDESKPNRPKLSISKPVTIINTAPSSPIKLSISEPVIIINTAPSPPVKLGFSKLKTVVDIAPSAPELSISGAVDEPQSKAPKLGISEIVTIIDSAPSNAVIISTPEEQPSQNRLPRWRWLRYLFLMLSFVILLFAVSYGESARRERNMWLEANDFTRRAVYSVRAGGGTGTGVPSWLWDDQLLDPAKYYYR